MSSLLDSEPSTYEETSKHQCWKDAMTKEYESILKNDVRDIVPRLKGKFFVTSKCIFKIKHAADGSIEKYKARFVHMVSLREREWITMRLLHMLLDLILFILSYLLHQL